MEILSDIDRDLDAIHVVFSADRNALWRALDDIAERPHRELIKEIPKVVPARVDAMAPHLLGQSVTQPGAVTPTDRRAHFRTPGRKWRYLKVLHEESRLSFDTLPNQLVAHFIRLLLRRLREHQRSLRELPESLERDATVQKMRRIRTRLTAILERGEALRQASAPDRLAFNNLTLRNEPRFARVLKAYLTLTRRSRR